MNSGDIYFVLTGDKYGGKGEYEKSKREGSLVTVHMRLFWLRKAWACKTLQRKRK
jgi:hypothetical protein